MTDLVPRLTSDTIVLRGYEERDFPCFAKFAASDRAQFVGGPMDAADSWRSFLAAIGHWTLRGYGMWVIEDRATGQVAGRAGIIFNDGWHEPELGWHIYDGFEGKGVAYEACVMAREYSAQNFGLDRVMSYICKDNHRSLRLATRLGAKFENNVEMRGEPVELWRHPSALEGAA